MQGAIEDYTAAMELPGTPIDQLGRALRNRSNARAVIGDNQGSRADLDVLIGLVGAPTYLVAKALKNRGDKKAQEGNLAGAMQGYQSVTELPDVSDDQSVSARYGLAVLKSLKESSQTTGPVF